MISVWRLEWRSWVAVAEQNAVHQNTLLASQLTRPPLLLSHQPRHCCIQSVHGSIRCPRDLPPLQPARSLSSADGHWTIYSTYHANIRVGFQVNRFRGFGAPGVENDPSPLTWHIALTTVYALTCYTVIIKPVVTRCIFKSQNGQKCVGGRGPLRPSSLTKGKEKEGKGRGKRRSGEKDRRSAGGGGQLWYS